jgi:hypothetical protein
MRDLMDESLRLLKREQHSPDTTHDYSFVVFSAAKAYEGFLKKMLFDLKLINKQQYMGDRFRIGKSLNPHLPKRYQWDWVFSKLAVMCGGEALPMQLWQTWKMARNRIFHYFPDHHEFISLTQAADLLDLLESTMESAIKGCNLNSSSGKFRIQNAEI